MIIRECKQQTEFNRNSSANVTYPKKRALQLGLNRETQDVVQIS